MIPKIAPVDSSWVNQIEIWFSILQRRDLRYGSFESAEMLNDQVLGFIRFWNRYEAHPFRWTFSGKFVQTPVHLAAYRSECRCRNSLPTPST